jgi:peptide/nickel transport system substrate-binding protein
VARYRQATFGRLVVALSVLSLVAAACGNDNKNGGGGGDANAPKGGSIVLGAEQWPDCINPITQCANSSWMHWVTDQYVLPKLMYLDAKNDFKASALLKEAPTTANGGLKTSPKFTITYKLNPNAVWDDGSKITSKDIAFSWKAWLKTTGTITTVGYEKIESVDTSDPETAIITFSEPFADWPDLFGGNSGYVLKAAAFPGVNPDAPDLKDQMADKFGFSGGPWVLQSFSKQQAVLVRNTKYWDKDNIPLLDQVTFVPRTDQDTEINSLVSGEVAAIYPQPSPQFSQKLKQPNIKFVTGGGTTFEGLWLNLSKPPLNDPVVRHALMLAVDRQAILQQIILPDSPNAELLNCGGWVPTVGKWCDQSQFADIKYDPAQAKTLLQGAGWTLGADGVFAKAGKKLDFEFNTVQGNTRRENIQQLIIQQAKAAGITFHVKNYDRTQLFQNVIPHLNHTVAIYAQVASSDPSVTSIFAADQIPTAANKFSGQNDSAWNNAAATELMKKSDQEVDINKRVDLIHQVGKKIREDYVWLPFYQLPLITAWRTDKVAGPVSDFNTNSYTSFYTINKWHRPS